MKSILDIYNELLEVGRHYPTTYASTIDVIKESSYFLYDLKDSTEEKSYSTSSYDFYVKEKSPLFYDRVINNEQNQDFINALTEEAPFYHMAPSIYSDDSKIKISDTRDVGLNNVPSALHESEFYETWFRDAFGYIQNLLILDGYNKLRYPYINENQYLYAQVFSKLSKLAFDESEDSESRIAFNDTEEANNLAYDPTYKYYGDEIGSLDYINDIIEKKIISNYVFIDFSSEQSNFLTNLINSMYESGQISYSEMDSEKLVFKLQEIKNELLRRKFSGSYTLYKLALNSVNRNGSYVSVLQAGDVKVETNTTLTTASSSNNKRPIRLLNIPGLFTETVEEYDDSIDPIKVFYEKQEDDNKIPLKLLVPIYYTSADVKTTNSLTNVRPYNNEEFYTLGYTSYEDSQEYIKNTTVKKVNSFDTFYLRDNSNVIEFNSLEGIISQKNVQKYTNSLDRLHLNEYGEVNYITLDSTTVDKNGDVVPYALDQEYQIIDLNMTYTNFLDVNADHLMYHINSVQQLLGNYYDYLTYPIADGNGVCLMDTFWLNYIQYQIENKTKVNDTTFIGTQVNTFVDLENRQRQAVYEFFAISYEDDNGEIEEYNDSIKYVLLWYCVINYDTVNMHVNSFNKTLITRITLRSDAPANFVQDGEIKSEYKDCEAFTKYNVGVIPFTYRDLVNDKIRNIQLGFYDNTFKDDAQSQGYGKAYFVFSKYDLTSYSSDRGVDPYDLSKNPQNHSSIFVNDFCDDIKTIYYVIKKIHLNEIAKVNRAGYFKNNTSGSIIESSVSEDFAWSDPIRVIKLSKIEKLIFDEENQLVDNIHFSPDWEGLSYYLNPYLNFTENSASPLRHKTTYKAYNYNKANKVVTIEESKGTVNEFYDLFNRGIVNTPSNGDIYYVKLQGSYYIYDEFTDSWNRYEKHDTIDGPSLNTSLSNLTRMRRLDFAANDLGEIAPTHWVDIKYHPEFEAEMSHSSNFVYGLYLNKCQPKIVDKSHDYTVSCNIKGDNRNRDKFDFEYKNVIYVDGNLSDIEDLREDALYIKTYEDRLEKYMFVAYEGYNDFVRVTDSDLESRSSINYSDLTCMPCLSLEKDYKFTGSNNTDNIQNSYTNYYKLSPCSEESLTRDIIYTTGSILDLKNIRNSLSLNDRRKIFYVKNNDNQDVPYLFINGNFNQINVEDYKINDFLEKDSKNKWYWNNVSKDGLTVCFNLELPYFKGFYSEFSGRFSIEDTYYFKKEDGTYIKKRPSDYPAVISAQDNLYVNKFIEVGTSETEERYKKCGYGEEIGNVYYIKDHNGTYKKDNHLVSAVGGVYNPHVTYYTYNGDNPSEATVENSSIAVIDNSLYGTQVGFLGVDLYDISFSLRSVSDSEYDTAHTPPSLYKKGIGESIYTNCSQNEYFNRNYTYYTVNKLKKVKINEQLYTNHDFFEMSFSQIENESDICFEGTEDIISYFIAYSINSSEVVYVQCTPSDIINNDNTYYKYVYNSDTDTYEYVKLTEGFAQNLVGSPVPCFYTYANGDYSLASGKYNSTLTYYKFVGYETYKGENFYDKSGEGKGYYVRNNIESSQMLIYREADGSSEIDSEFDLTLNQITGKEAVTFNFSIYPTGKSSEPITIISDEITFDYINSRNIRVAASAYKTSDTLMIMSIVIDDKMKSEVIQGSDFSNFPVKYIDSEETQATKSLNDIILFTKLSGDNQVNIFYGNIYDIRLYNRGKSPQELMLLNMGTMRELYSYSPSVYKLAHSIYEDVAYLKIVDNSIDNLENKHIGAIRVFNRSVWDSIMVDNFPVSTYEMDPLSPQYYKNYQNPLYDTDIYQTNINSLYDISYSTRDCVEQSLLDKVEVFNGKSLEQVTSLVYNNKRIILNPDDRITAVMSTIIPVDYDNDPIVSENVDFEMIDNTVVSKINPNTDLIKINLSLDSSDDYFRYVSDMTPNFLINSDFNLAMWMSRGTNISLTYDKYLDDSYVTLANPSIKNSNVNDILVPLVLPKQSSVLTGEAVGYLDMFKISNFKLSSGLIKLLRATSYYSEVRIPQPCLKHGYDYVIFDASEYIPQTSDQPNVEIPNYYVKVINNGITTYECVNYGYFEAGVTYYKYNPSANPSYYESTVTYGDEISHYYVKDSNDNYVSAYGNFESNVTYYKYALTNVPSYYNKWDGIRVLKEGTYYTTCKYPIKLMPFNDDEFDSTDKSNYATVYGTVRFKIEVSSVPKDMCYGEQKQYEIKGIPLKYTKDNIEATLSNRSELIDPDDNRTFPHRQFNIKLYAMGLSEDGSTSMAGLAGYMEKNETTKIYEEKYNFEWKLIASNDFDDCYERVFRNPQTIVPGNTYYVLDNDGHYIMCSDDEVPEYPSLCYEFVYKNNGITYLDKDTLNNKCFITQEVPMFMSKNYTMPFFIAGQVKTEDDENFELVTDSTSADDDLIEPIRIRPNFTKISLKDKKRYFSSEKEKIKADSADDLDKLVLIAGKTYELLFDYTAKVSELARINDILSTQLIDNQERTKYCQYYSLIDSLGILDSEFEYTTDGESFTVPSQYGTDKGAGVLISSSSYTVVTDANEVAEGISIPANKYYVKDRNNNYLTAAGFFKKNETYYKRTLGSYVLSNSNDYCFGNPYSSESSSNNILTTQNKDNIEKSYKIYYMIETDSNMVNYYDINNNSTPDKSVRINKMMAYYDKTGSVGVVSGFSETKVLKTLYKLLLNEDLVSSIQSPSVGLISGFTKVVPNISYRNYLNPSLKISDTLCNKNVKVYRNTHDLYSYSSSSRELPYKGSFDVTRTTCFRNNLLKGKQLDLLNKNYWDVSGDYSTAEYVNDEDFGKTVVKFSNVTELELLYDGGGYELESALESAINIKASDINKINKVTISFYNSKNDIVEVPISKTATINEIDLIKDESSDSNIYNYHYDVETTIKTSKIRFKIVASDIIDITIGKIIVRGNGTTKIANGLANVYYSNSFVDENVIVASHIVPVLKDLETEQYIPIQFKNGKIISSSITRPNPGLNLASSFISKNMISGYGKSSKTSKLNKPWIRKFYYDHAGLNKDDSLDQSAYFHKYIFDKDSLNYYIQKEIPSNVNDIMTFTSKDKKVMDSDKCVVCNRVINSETGESYFTLRIGSSDSAGNIYGINMNLDNDGTLAYYGNNMIVNPQSPISIFNERVSMTYNCFNLDNYRNNVSSPTVITNVQLLDNKLLDEGGSYDKREVIYEFEYLPIIYDELTHHVSFNIMIRNQS